MLSINPFQLKQTQTKIHLLKNCWSFNWATNIGVNETTPSLLNSSRHNLMVFFLFFFFFWAKWFFSICESILWVNLVKSIQTSCSFFSLIPFPLVEIHESSFINAKHSNDKTTTYLNFNGAERCWLIKEFD